MIDTDCKPIAQEISRLKHFYENLIAKIPGHIYWLTPSGVILGCNDQQAIDSGYQSHEDIVGKTLADTPWAHQEAYLLENNRKILASGKAQIIEELCTQEGESDKIYLSHKTPLYDENGEALGILGISFDITTQKEAEKIFIEAEKLKIENARLEKEKAEIEKTDAEKYATHMKTLAGIIAHELRTPLAGIKLGIQGLQSFLPKLLDGYEKAVAANLVTEPLLLRQRNALASLLPNILSQAENGNLIIDLQLQNISNDHIDSLHFEQYSMADIVTTAIETYPANPEEKNLIHFENTNDFTFSGDKTLTKHIFWNLLKNAFYYIKMQQRGEIYIWFAETEHEYQVYFKDTAKGIAPDVIDKIFTEFYSQRISGTGLGLSFCKLAMHAFNGDISCNSVLGEYAEFVLHFRK